MSGVIDPDYTREVKVLLINAAPCYHYTKRGDPIAQLILEKVSLPILKRVDDLPPTKRGVHGCGFYSVNIFLLEWVNKLFIVIKIFVCGSL